MLAMSLSALAGLAGAFLVIGTVGVLARPVRRDHGDRARPARHPRPGVVAPHCCSALTSGGKSMGIQSGIPFDLPVHHGLVICSSPRQPDRSVWRIRSSIRRRA
jgi:hypothetical protein